VHKALGGAFPKRHHLDCGGSAIICKVPVFGRYTMAHQEISKKYKCQSLGMPKAPSSSLTKISGHLSRHYIFIASYDIFFSWSVFIFAFSFVLFCLL
jgi:hypothetical protein